jgi:hypothetical protein
MSQKFRNLAKSTLTSTITSGQTSLTIGIAAADLFPVANTDADPVPTSGKDYFKIVLQDSSGNIEIAYVRTRELGSAVMSNIIRGQEGTTALAFLSGSIVALRHTAQDLQDVRDAADAATAAVASKADVAYVDSVRTDLANTTDPLKGDALLGTKLPFAGAKIQTQHDVNQDFIFANSFDGVVGDGVNDDTDGVMAAIASLGASGGSIWFKPGTYLFRRTTGTNDKWGLKITTDNVTLIGYGVKFKRYNPSITTYATAYPILFCGTPDSNVAAATKAPRAIGIEFVGEDTRHAISGASINDYRVAIYCKNTVDSDFDGAKFTNIDSGSIWYQSPVSYDYANGVYFNTTKNYRGRINNCKFLANSHAVARRSLIHAIEAMGIDDLTITDCRADWCDNFFSADTTYDKTEQVETDTYLPTVAGWSLGVVKRSGRGHYINDSNVITNSSEHSIYAASMDVQFHNNHVRVTDPVLCSGDVKVRAKGFAASGNNMVTALVAFSVCEPSLDVNIFGNNEKVLSEAAGGAYEIQAIGLASYVTGRSDYLTHQPMSNINIHGNTVVFPSGAATVPENAVGLRIYAPVSSDANYPLGMVRGVKFNGNTVSNHGIGLYVIGSNHNIRNVDFIGNTLTCKPFAGAFGVGTTMNTYAAVAINASDTSVLFAVNFDGNTVQGSKYLFATLTGGGASVYLPNTIRSNTLNQIQFFSTTDMRTPIIDLTVFDGNVGSYFIDRTRWLGEGTGNNALGDLTLTTNSHKKYRTWYDGTNYRFGTDDAGTSIVLG